jgi:hypothetical protein
MPFHPAPASASLLALDFHWGTQPHFGESVNGDALFLEDSRSDGLYHLLLLDAMGHGAAAATVIVHLEQHHLRDPACWNCSPAALLTLLHSWLAPRWDECEAFVAALAVLVEPGGHLVGSSGGQPQPRQRTTAPGCVSWGLPPGGCLGFPFPQPFVEDRLGLAVGEGLLAFTDGVVGAPQSTFGDSQLATFLKADPMGPGVVGRLLGFLPQHVPGVWPTDDTTAYWIEWSVSTHGQ